MIKNKTIKKRKKPIKLTSESVISVGISNSKLKVLFHIYFAE